MSKGDNIELIPVGQPVGPLKWQMSMNGGPPQGGNGKFPDIVVPKGETDTITFTIRHPGSIRFAQQDAFCAQLGTSKPQVCDMNDFSFTGGGSTKLVVTDKNITAGDFTYVVNFTGGTPQLDPIIKNGGGGTGIAKDVAFSTVTYEVVGVVLLVALVAFVARRMFMRAPMDTTKGP